MSTPIKRRRATDNISGMAPPTDPLSAFKRAGKEKIESFKSGAKDKIQGHKDALAEKATAHKTSMPLGYMTSVNKSVDETQRNVRYLKDQLVELVSEVSELRRVVSSEDLYDDSSLLRRIKKAEKDIEFLQIEVNKNSYEINIHKGWWANASWNFRPIWSNGNPDFKGDSTSLNFTAGVIEHDDELKYITQQTVFWDDLYIETCLVWMEWDTATTVSVIKVQQIDDANPELDYTPYATDGTKFYFPLAVVYYNDGSPLVRGIPVDLVSTSGSSGGTTVLPAKITGAGAWTVSIYGGADGFASAATETNVTLDDIMNVAAGQYFPIGTELWVLTAGSKRYGLVNGVF